MHREKQLKQRKREKEGRKGIKEEKERRKKEKRRKKIKSVRGIMILPEPSIQLSVWARPGQHHGTAQGSGRIMIHLTDLIFEVLFSDFFRLFFFLKNSNIYTLSSAL